MQIELGDAVACQLFCGTVYPDGIEGAALDDLHEAHHVGFQVRNAAKPPLECGEGDFGTYLGLQEAVKMIDDGPNHGSNWWAVAIKELAFNGYKSVLIYDSFEELKSKWTLDL